MRLQSNPLVFLVALGLGSALFTEAASAQVTLRCGGGTVQTNGFVINAAGEVVFSENSIACNVNQNPGLPAPLALSITSPAANAQINVSAGPQNVSFAAQITNYTQSIDSCNVQVLPPGAGSPWPAVALTPNGNGAAAANIAFTQGIPGGTYNLRLSCQRTANGQQIVVSPVSRALTVVSTPPQTQCASNPIPNIFNNVIQRGFTDAYTGPPPPMTDFGEGGFGVLPNVTSNWRYWSLVNSYANGSLTGATLRTWKFRPTSGSFVQILKGSMGGAQIALSISECPGQFQGLAAACTSATGGLTWSTIPGDPIANRCKLDPTKDYYISTAQFDLNHLLATGQYRSTYGVCAGSSCSVEYVYQVQNKRHIQQ